MSRIKKIEKLTDSKYLNLYQLEAVNRLGKGGLLCGIQG